MATAGVDTMDPAGGDLTLRPRGIPSGTGDDIADSFDPEVLVQWLTARERSRQVET